MKFESIDEVFTANARIRQELAELIAAIPHERVTEVPDGEKWSIQQILEHLVLVDRAALQICSRLLDGARADAKPPTGGEIAGAEFKEKVGSVFGAKLEAPNVVQPTGNVPIAESMSKLEQNQAKFEQLIDDLGKYDLTGHKFPHPYFGPLTAAEWLIMAGGHEARHMRQIKARL